MQRSVSIAFQTDKPITAYGPLAKTVEDFGFSGVSVYNDMLYQPAWLPLLEIARHTTRVRIGPAAVNPFTCHPINIAGNIALLDEASHGRAYLGLARGAWLDFVGVQAQRPVTALREAFGCIRHLLSQSPEPYAGQVFSLAGGEALRWKISRPDVPFLLGTWGAQTLAALRQTHHRGQTRRNGQSGRGVLDAERPGRQCDSQPTEHRRHRPRCRSGDGDRYGRQSGPRAGAPRGRAVSAGYRRAGPQPWILSRSCWPASERPAMPTTSTGPAAISPMTCCDGWRSPERLGRWRIRLRPYSRREPGGSSSARPTVSRPHRGCAYWASGCCQP